MLMIQAPCVRLITQTPSFVFSFVASLSSDWATTTGGLLSPKEAFTLDANQPKFDVIDNLRKVAIGRKLR